MNTTNELIEIYIYRSQGQLIKVALNYSRGTCIVRDMNGGVLMTLKNLSPKRMHEIKVKIITYIAEQKKFRGFSSGVYYL